MSSGVNKWAAYIPIAIIAVGLLVRANRTHRRAVELEAPRSRAEPVRISPDALPERAVGGPIVNRYRSSPLEPTDEDVKGLVEAVTFDHWYGLYMGKRKVGFAREVMRKTTGDEPGGYLSSVDIAMRSGVAGKTDVIFECEANYYATKPPYRLVALRTLSKSSTGEVSREFAFDERGGTLSETVNKKPREKRSTSPTKDDLRGLFASVVAGPERVRVGQSVEYPTFDAEQLRDAPMALKVTALTERRVEGVTVPILTLAVDFPEDNLKGSVVVAHGGRPLEGSIGDDIELRPEPRAIAIDQAEAFDALLDGVEVSGSVGDPERRQSLTLELSAASDFEPPNRPNQRVTRAGKQRFRVEIDGAPGAAVAPSERSEALASTASVNAESLAIKEQAKELTNTVGDRAAQVQALLDFVDENVADSMVSDLSVASQVLERRTGDCTEHTLLFIALCRSLGIPARELSGLVYTGAVEERFAWHAWAEVELDGHWVPVNPTLGQARADVTHLVLGAGRDARWMSSLASLRIEVVD